MFRQLHIKAGRTARVMPWLLHPMAMDATLRQLNLELRHTLKTVFQKNFDNLRRELKHDIEGSQQQAA